MSQYLILLALIPIGCFQLTKMFSTENKWLYRGMSLGLVIAPLSYSLLQFAYVPYFGKFIAMLGLIVNLTHGTVGYFCLAGAGVFEPGVVLTAPQLTLIHLVNAVIFSSLYGIIGYAVDRKLAVEDSRVAVRVS